MPGLSTWQVGTLTVPSSTGSVAVTGLGGTPKALFFFGTNWLTEDTAVTSTGTGVFRGMCAPKYDAPGTLLQNGVCVHPTGAAHLQDDHAINILDAGLSGSTLYRADVSSLDAGGFTLNWVTAAAGGYKVVYAALMDAANVGAFEGLYSQSGLAFGFKAGASLLHGTLGGTVAGNLGYSLSFYGGAAYPGTNHLGWKGAGITAYAYPPSSGQYITDIQANDPTNIVTSAGHFTGPFLVSSTIVAFPSGAGLTDFDFGGESGAGGMVVAWDDEDTMTGFASVPVSAAGTSTVSGLSFAPGLLIGYSISDEPSGQGSGTARGAVGLSVVTPDMQWTALVDGVSRGSYQSFSRGFSDAVSGTSVHAGTVDLTGDGFVMTTVEDAATGGSWVWHAFGHPKYDVAWIPQIRRHHMAY